MDGVDALSHLRDAVAARPPLPPVTGRGAGMIAAAIILPVVVSIWTGLRIWTRRIRELSIFFTEDILCYLGLISYWALAVNYVCMVVLGGAGHHFGDLHRHHVMRFSQAAFAAQVLYALTLGFTKMSITWMIKRIFFERSYVYIAYLIMAFNVCWMLQTVLTGVLICRPITLNWVSTARGHCGNQTLAFAAVSIVDIITDLLILAMPLKMLWGLQMKRVYKIALGCMFGAGIITIAFTVVRLYSVFALDFSDMTYTFVPVSIIGMVQSGVAITVASAPLMRPAFDRTITSLLNISGSTRRSEGKRKSTDKLNGKSLSQTKSSGAATLRLSIPKRCKSPAGVGFHQISESEENLRWEMDVMHADKGKTLTEVSNSSNGHCQRHDESLPVGHIKVTHSTQVSRQ